MKDTIDKLKTHIINLERKVDNANFRAENAERAM